LLPYFVGTGYAGVDDFRPEPALSGDDVRDQAIFEQRDLVTQRKLALFEARQPQLIGRILLAQRGDRGIEIAMFRPKRGKPFADLLLFVHTKPPAAAIRSLALEPPRPPVVARIAMFADCNHVRGRHGNHCVIYSMSVNQPRRTALMQTAHYSALEARHEALERKISAESHRPLPDQRTLADLKKQKLRVKEELAAL
jgi:hypothetical protein